MAIHPPQATVTGYTLTPYTVSTSIDTLLTVIEFSFERKMIWTTLSQIFADQGFETMPQQEIEAYEFVLHKPNAKATEIAALESFLDAHFGAAVPFHFTAPDDNVVYAVQFKEDKIQYSNPAAGYTPVLFSLVTAGDVAGTLDNSLVYPSYITLSPGPGTGSGGGSGGSGDPLPATGTVRTGLIAEYLMVGGSGPTITDTSGNGHTATLGITGSAAMQAALADSSSDIFGFTYSAPTRLDTGISFNQDAVITLTDGSIVDSSVTDFSAELWLYPLSQGNIYFDFGWFDHFLQDNGNPTGWWPRYTDNASSFGPSIVQPSLLTSFPWGTGPYQAVIVRDAVTKNLATWVNGVLAMSTLTDSFIHSGDFDPPEFYFDTSTRGLPYSAVRLIGNSMSLHGGVNAVMGEIRFYGKALTGSEIVQNFNARKAFYGLA